MTTTQDYGTIFDYISRAAEAEAQRRAASAIGEMESRFLRRDYQNLKARVQDHIDKGEQVPEELVQDYVRATLITGNLENLIKGIKPKKKEAGGLLTKEVLDFFKDEATKIAMTGLVPALALDAAGVFGNYGSIDSLLTPVTAVGGMAGYYGGKNHLIDGPLLAGTAYVVGKIGALIADLFKDGKINEFQPEAVKYLAAYALAALAGKAIQYTKNNLPDKTKLQSTGKVLGTAGYETLKGIGKATLATGKGLGAAGYATGKFAGNYSGLAWLGRKLHILPKKVSLQAAVVTDTQHRPLRDVSGAEIVVEGSDPNIQRFE